MPPEPAASGTARESVRARATRAREHMATRIKRTRMAIVAGVAAVTCALAVLISFSASGSATGATHSSTSGVSRSTQPRFDDGGSTAPRASAPTASSGRGDVVSGGS
jgi:hypothetical protein